MIQREIFVCMYVRVRASPVFNQEGSVVSCTEVF